MKKSTVVLLLLSFFFMVIVVVGVFITLMVLVMQGSTPNLLGSKRLALIRVEGVIYDASEWVDQVQEYQKDTSVKAIIVRVESPGGAVDPSQELYQALVEAQEVYGKVVVASFGSIAASGGYYVACNADQIVSSPGSLTGSIGVYSKFPVAKELMDKIGITYETIKAGEYKDFGSMERGLTDKERAMMQAVINDTYEQFVEAVLKGRKKPFSLLMKTWENPATLQYPFTPDLVQIILDFQKKRKTEALNKPTALVAAPSQSASPVLSASPAIVSSAIASATFSESTASGIIQEATEEKSDGLQPDDKTLFALAQSVSEGKIYTGRQALKVGLVDQLGTLEDAIQLAADMVGIRGEPTVIERKKREYGLLDYLTQGLNNLTTNQTHSPVQYRYPY